MTCSVAALRVRPGSATLVTASRVSSSASLRYWRTATSIRSDAWPGSEAAMNVAPAYAAWMRVDGAPEAIAAASSRSEASPVPWKRARSAVTRLSR
jgi:hypothetical protein